MCQGLRLMASYFY